MKILNDITCNLNWIDFKIQIELSLNWIEKKMGCKFVKVECKFQKLVQWLILEHLKNETPKYLGVLRIFFITSG